MLKLLFLLYILFTIGQASHDENTLNRLLQNLNVDRDTVTLKDLPKPDDIAFGLTEDEFEDYLDFWLIKQYADERQQFQERAGCSVQVNSLTEPQPVFVLGNSLKVPSGITGNIVFGASEIITASCVGTKNTLVHSSATQNPVQSTVVCQTGTYFTGPGWLSGQVNFSTVKCASHVPWIETKISGTCGAGQGIKINVAIQTNTASYVIMTACFKESTSEALYVEYDQNVENKVHQSNVGRPDFQQGQWYPGLSVNTLYTQVSQKSAIASQVGSALADKYVTSTSFLARGHLAAKTDFVLSPSQRATFTFINVAPQWQPFNGGNWNTLEQNLRHRIGDTGKKTRVYTGTWDILKLKDSNGNSKSIHLNPSTNKIPVPLWFYKVIHEPSTNKATAYLGLNNPYVTLQEAKNMAFCTDVCNGNSQFSWLNWKAQDMGLGFSICCEVNDFRKTVNHLPSFTVSGLLY